MKIESEQSEIAVGKEVQAWWSDGKDLHSCQILYLHGKQISFFLGHLFLNTRTMYTMSSCILSFKLRSFIFPKNFFSIHNYYFFSIDDATVLLEKEREFLKDPKSFKMGTGIKSDQDTSQRIPKLSVNIKVIAHFSHLQ